MVSIDHGLLPLDLQSSGQAADYKSAVSKNVIESEGCLALAISISSRIKIEDDK